MVKLGGFIEKLGKGGWRRLVLIAGIAAIALLFLSTLTPQSEPQAVQQYTAEETAKLETSVILPKVRGVAVVCGGAEDIVIREKVVNTAARVLDIKVSQVYVTS